jgi:hypothetical protein
LKIVFYPILPRLRASAFEAELTRMSEDGRAVALDMLIEPDAVSGLGQDRCERGFADLERVTPHVVAVPFDEIEGKQEHVPIMLADDPAGVLALVGSIDRG